MSTIACTQDVLHADLEEQSRTYIKPSVTVEPDWLFLAVPYNDLHTWRNEVLRGESATQLECSMRYDDLQFLHIKQQSKAASEARLRRAATHGSSKPKQSKVSTKLFFNGKVSSMMLNHEITTREKIGNDCETEGRRSGPDA